MRFRLPFLGRPSGVPDPDGEREPPTPVEIVRAYHLATRHHEHAFARAPGYMDWDTQPDPFRRYAGAESIALEHVPLAGGPAYADAFVEGRVPPAAVDRRSVSQLFADALGLTAWKALGETRWALRANPSSGNLHPTEGYLVGRVDGLGDRALVAHYAPREHALEVRAHVPDELAAELTGADGPAFFVALTSIHWREAWKYGERAYRYCQHDVGHALAGLALAAGALGWRVRVADALGHDDLVRLLGLRAVPDVEPEEPDLLLAVFADTDDTANAADHATADEAALPASVPDGFGALPFAGEPNALSPERVDWDAIEAVSEAARKPRTETVVHAASASPTPSGASVASDRPGTLGASSSSRASGTLGTAGALVASGTELGADLELRRIVRQRRSAVAFDRKTELPRATFLAMLANTLPTTGRVPFTALPWPTRIHLGLFVNRVTDLEPGLYLFSRDADRTPLLKAAMQRPFAWRRPAEVPEGLELFLLAPGNVQPVARGVSCGQDIASDGAFAIAMLAELEPALKTDGAWAYPRLHWEAGAVGQVLYLDAEAAGVRATGIGCFFDEPTQRVFGLGSDTFRTVYHFTVGGAVEDERLTSLPPYPAQDAR